MGERIPVGIRLCKCKLFFPKRLCPFYVPYNKYRVYIFLCRLVPQGVNTISIEIYDERSFMMDELIAWTQIQIPKQVLLGETHEEWYPLNGKQGEGVEGMINLVMSYTVSVSCSLRIFFSYFCS